MTQKKQNYRFFQNKECEYFPCHDIKNVNEFNCMFCYCPLYLLGTECGGNYICTEDGIKDCSACKIPHMNNGYDFVLSKLKTIKNNE